MRNRMKIELAGNAEYFLPTELIKYQCKLFKLPCCNA